MDGTLRYDNFTIATNNIHLRVEILQKQKILSLGAALLRATFTTIPNASPTSAHEWHR